MFFFFFLNQTLTNDKEKILNKSKKGEIKSFPNLSTQYRSFSWIVTNNFISQSKDDKSTLARE